VQVWNGQITSYATGIHSETKRANVSTQTIYNKKVKEIYTRIW
jgi:hypothetical protein